MSVKADTQELKILYTDISNHVARYHRLVTEKFLAMKKLSVSGTQEGREKQLNVLKARHQRQRQTVRKLDSFFAELRQTLNAFEELNTTQGKLKTTITHVYDSLDRVIKRFEKQLVKFEKRNDKHEKILEKLAQDPRSRGYQAKLRSAIIDEVNDLVKFLISLKDDLADLKMVSYHESSDIKALTKKELEQIISNIDKGGSDSQKELIKKTRIMPSLRAILRNIGTTGAAMGFFTLLNISLKDTPDVPIDLTMIVGLTLMTNMLFLTFYNELKKDDLFNSVRDLDPDMAARLRATFQN